MANQADIIARLKLEDKEYKAALKDSKNITEGFKQSVQSVGKEFSAMGIEGGGAFDAISRAMGGSATAMAALPIAGLIASFKLLNREAEKFFNTFAGGMKKAGMQAYLDQFGASINSATSGSAMEIANYNQDLKKRLARWKGAYLLYNDGRSWSEIQSELKQADKDAMAAAMIAKNLLGLERQLDAEMVNASSKAAAAAEALLGGDRKEATRAIREQYGEQIRLNKAIAEQMRLALELPGSTEEAVREYNAQLAAVNALEEAMNRALRRAGGRKSGGGGGGKGKGKTPSAELPNYTNGYFWYASVASEIEHPATILAESAKDVENFAYRMGQAWEDYAEKARKAHDESIRLQDMFEGFSQDFSNAVVASFSQGVQELMTCLMDIQNANWGNVLQAVLDPFAQMAIKMGEILMAEGIGTLAAREIAPEAQIAAGMALIAAGAAAQAGLAKAAKSLGGGSGSAATTSASGTSSPDKIETELTIKVEGKILGSDIQIAGARTLNKWNR